jgi:thymidylate kinase
MTLQIAFEGIPGGGKTTVINFLTKELTTRGLRTLIVDIDNTKEAPILHTIARTFPYGDPARVMFYWLLRIQQYDAMQEGSLSGQYDIILADRFWSSTLAFDVDGAGVPIECWNWASQHIQKHPDITFFFDLPFKFAEKRKKNGIMSNNAFTKRVINRYYQLAEKLSWNIVDATQDVSSVGNYCLQRILSLHKQH